MPDDQVFTGFLKNMLEKFIDIGQEQTRELKLLKESIEKLHGLMNSKPCLFQISTDKCQQCAIQQSEKARQRSDGWTDMLLKAIISIAGLVSAFTMYKYLFLK